MATADMTARNSRADNLASGFSTATLTISEGVTVLATHTLAGFSAASAGSITANAIANAVIAVNGTADNAKIESASGSYSLTVGLSASGADIEISNLTFISGEESSVSGFTVTFPA